MLADPSTGAPGGLLTMVTVVSPSTAVKANAI